MQDLIKQEQFELEVLERLNSARLLGSLVFCGGTMLRLCFGLNRFSVDLDFWLARAARTDKLFRELKKVLSAVYIIKDAAPKHKTLLFEVRSRDYPRSLKIEIRREAKKVKAEQAIAYSKYAQSQVFLKVVSLPEMMQAKAAALLQRREIRDAFDLEFLFKMGLPLDFPAVTLEKILALLDTFTQKDYAVKLGSLLESREREYYRAQHFRILKLAIQKQLQGSSLKKPDATPH